MRNIKFIMNILHVVKIKIIAQRGTIFRTVYAWKRSKVRDVLNRYFDVSKYQIIEIDKYKNPTGRLKTLCLDMTIEDAGVENGDIIIAQNKMYNM